MQTPVRPHVKRAPARVVGLIALAVLAPAHVAGGQWVGPTEPRYDDPGAAALHRAAMRHHAGSVDRLQAYEATVRQRIGVALRTPLRDRTVYRAESAHRVFWRKEGPASIEVIGLREQTPGGVELEDLDHGLVDHVFEPDRDRLLLGRSESDANGFRIRHPLEQAEASDYAFASGDTVTLALPDGRRVSAIELLVSPRVRHASRISGSLWIEPESGALARATYRLSETLDLVRDMEDLREEDARGEFRWVPGIFKPWTFELSIITVDYALWDDAVWLPRSWRGEGLAVAGILRIPAEFDRSYRFDRVATLGSSGEATVAEDEDIGFFHVRDAQSGSGSPYRVLERPRRRGARDVRIVVATDPRSLAASADLPPPVWEDAPGFIARGEIEAQVRRLDRIPTGAQASTPWWFRWGLQRPDLVRYNRVEELSVGAHVAARPQLLGRPLSAIGTVRLGTGDLRPNVRLDLDRSTLRRSITLSAYHELAATEEGSRHLGLGNSLLAAFAGRDDGDYYRRSGAEIAWSSPPTARASYRIAIHSERHAAADVETRLALPRLWNDDAWAFRPNVRAAEGWEHALQVRVSPSWGTDPQRVQVGLEATGMASVGDHEQALAALGGRLAVPLPADLRVGVAAGGGIATTRVTPQRAFAVGGPATLRGYAPRVLVGPCTAQTRVEVQRRFAFGGISAFSDAGWAGPCASLRPSAVLRSAGLGLSIVDGLIRLDLSRGIDDPRGTRLDLYLDGPF